MFIKIRNGIIFRCLLYINAINLVLLQSCSKNVGRVYERMDEYTEFVSEIGIHDDNNNERLEYTILLNPQTNDYLFLASNYDENNNKIGEAYIYIDADVITKVDSQELALPGTSKIQISESEYLNIIISEDTINTNYYSGVANLLDSNDTYSFQFPKDTKAIVTTTIIIVGIGATLCLILCLVVLLGCDGSTSASVTWHSGCTCNCHEGGSGN